MKTAYIAIILILAFVVLATYLAFSYVLKPATENGYLIIGIKDKIISGENVTAITLTLKSVQVRYSGREEKIEIEAKTGDDGTEVDAEWNGNETEFNLNTTNRDEIISVIVDRTGLGRTDIEKFIVFKNETSEAEESEETDVENKSSGWVTVFEGTKTFNLLDYTGNAAGILGETNLATGKYEQIRLFIENATITVGNTTYPLNVPSKVLKMVEGFQVEANKTLVLTLDFDAEHSIKKVNGTYVLKPVIKILKTETEKKTIGEIEKEIGEDLKDINEIERGNGENIERTD